MSKMPQVEQDKFLEVLKNSKILVDHMHIPLQSGSNEILKLMNRKYDLNTFISNVKSIQERLPNVSITTDVIVGFPQESDDDFADTLSTCKEIGFSS